jgi:ATP-dependent Lon protease
MDGKLLFASDDEGNNEIEEIAIPLDDAEIDETHHEDETPQIPGELPIVPLRGLVVFPFAVVPLGVGQERSIKLIDDAMRGDRLIGLAAQRDPEIEQGGPNDTYSMGTAARIARLLRLPNGTMQIIVQGIERIAIDEYIQLTPYLKARVHVAPDTTETGVEIEALKRNAVALFQRLVNLVQYLPDELSMAVLNIDDPRQVAYLIASTVRMDLALRQDVLETDSVMVKLTKINTFLTQELEVLEIGKRIQSEAQEEMGKAQREYFLREQLKAIQRELGEESDEAAAVNDLRERIESAQMSDEAQKEARRELSRLEKLPAASPEYSVIRTYLELLVSLPWSKLTGGVIDIAHAREVLDTDHYDLEKIKDRILEYLAVRKLREQRRAERADGAAPPMREPILCFVGPPGVGKTSLGQSIARALGREFVRMSLGGIHDEAEIRGHRRTYIGAMPGRIIQSLRRAGTRNPVMMLDEVDKVGADWRGDPSSALLEVLDPEQNSTFRDNYLDLAFDLSQVMFIATANTLETIPAALLDRMEVLQLSGYTEEQKLHIARRYLLPKQIATAALTPDEIAITDDALLHVVRDYTLEAGVRNLERRIADICRKVAKQVAEGHETPITVTPAQLREMLGRPIVPNEEVLDRIDRPGVVAGLSVTSYGGQVLFVEAAMMPGPEERLVLTGQLGEVMRESAQTALSFVRSNAIELGIDPHVFDGKSVHIHVPAGAVPKDGPSAGVTMMTAIVSLTTGRKVRADVAMTGEISLRGKVLPIGGLRDKALAAHRMGLRTVIFPAGNEPDLDDFPKELRAEMTFVPVSDAREVIQHALEPQAAPANGKIAPADRPAAAASRRK